MKQLQGHEISGGVCGSQVRRTRHETELIDHVGELRDLLDESLRLGQKVRALRLELFGRRSGPAQCILGNY